MALAWSLESKLSGIGLGRRLGRTYTGQTRKGLERERLDENDVATVAIGDEWTTIATGTTGVCELERERVRPK